MTSTNPAVPSSRSTISYRSFKPGFTISHTPTDVFTPFSKLPDELQMMIWHYTEASRAQRVLDMDWRPEFKNTVPALLQTCHLSRKIALEYNQLIRHQNQGHLFINPDVDILSFQDHERIWLYIKLWKNGRPTRRSETGRKVCKVMDYKAITKSLQHIYIKDRMSLGWTELPRFPVFKNLKAVILNCPWAVHEEDRIPVWRQHWEDAWKQVGGRIPWLTFSCVDCWCRECAGRGSLIHARCKTYDTLNSVEVVAADSMVEIK